MKGGVLVCVIDGTLLFPTHRLKVKPLLATDPVQVRDMILEANRGGRKEKKKKRKQIRTSNYQERIGVVLRAGHFQQHMQK